MRRNPVFKGRSRQSGRRVAKKATSYEQQGEEIVFRLYSTNIVVVRRDSITLNNGGWKTNTTQRRMNEISKEFDLGYRVYSVKGTWVIDYQGIVVPFSHGIVTVAK